MLNRLPLPTQLTSLSMLLDDIGRPSPRNVAHSLGVSQRSVARWMKADMAPRPVMLALFWLTRWGHHAVHCEAHNDAVMQAGIARSREDQIRSLRAQLDILGRIGDFGSANDPAPDVATPKPAPATVDLLAVVPVDHRQNQRNDRRSEVG